ncbi:MerR family transcriptional regulator [Sporomusa sp. KB1]|uniref:MerR family transcriptional regulator n=1 Tax=Sporomusa sp. KB1 TaxID=943346 RepID=UPI0011AE00A6|nr:MerR family transcriptional regulator [Sporomusa sp. KB1]TWH45527.1 DNA-binding transcriptional MerR regulator [Sporomusa sp. KB1]
MQYKKYKIGAMARLLGMSTEGLRYYEESGIITPKKQEDSKYRYYDVWDIHILVRARAYRRLGFSLQDVYAIINSQEDIDISQLLTEREKEIQAKIVYNINLLRRSRQIRAMYQDAQSMINQYRLEDCPGVYRINTQNKSNLISDPAVRLCAREWIEMVPFVFSSGLFPREEIEKGGEHYNLGFGIEEEYASYLKVAENEYVKYHPARLCVYTVLPSSSDVALTTARLSGALEYMQRHNLKLIDNAFSMLINFHKQADTYRNLHRVWLPVEY